LFSNFSRQKSKTITNIAQFMRGRLDDTGINITFLGGICPLQQDFIPIVYFNSISGAEFINHVNEIDRF